MPNRSGMEFLFEYVVQLNWIVLQRLVASLFKNLLSPMFDTIPGLLRYSKVSLLYRHQIQPTSTEWDETGVPSWFQKQFHKNVIMWNSVHWAEDTKQRKQVNENKQLLIPPPPHTAFWFATSYIACSFAPVNLCHCEFTQITSYFKSSKKECAQMDGSDANWQHNLKKTISEMLWL